MINNFNNITIKDNIIKNNSINSSINPVNYNSILESNFQSQNSNVSNNSSSNISNSVNNLNTSDLNQFNASLDSKNTNSLAEKRKLKKPRDDMDKTQFIINLDDVYLLFNKDNNWER